MKKLFSMRKEIEKILKDIGLKEINIRWTYNDRLSKVIAKVSYESGIRHPTLTVGSKLLKQSDDMKIRVLKHEIAHIYDRYHNKRASKHDKIFKDLCGKLYGDKTIGQATTKNWENWIR